MKLAFFGDGPWATDSLELLLEKGYEALCVVLRTEPSHSGLEEAARKANIPLLQPQRVNDPDFVIQIGRMNPDLNLSVSYDQFLGKAIRESAPRGFINCHAGMLPRYRGRNPINWALINNESEIGITVHYVDGGFDTGDILVQKSLAVGWRDDYGSLLKRVYAKLPGVVLEALDQIRTGKVDPRPQDHGQATYFCARREGDEWLDWSDTSLNLYNKVRAITRPAPGARTRWGDKILTIWRARYDPAWPKYLATCGEVLRRFGDGSLQVKTGDSTLILESYETGEMAPDRTLDIKVGTRFA